MSRTCGGCGGRIDGQDYRVAGMVMDGRGIPTNVVCHPGGGRHRMGKRRGRPGGMVQKQVTVSAALQAANGILSMRQAAALLEISYPQLYRWVCEGLPIIRKGRAFRLDAATLRTWVSSEKPIAWEVTLDDGLTSDDAEHDRRMAACRQMMARWGIQLSR